MTSKELEKFSDAEYRKAFVASQINIGIPFQIRGLMKAHGWTQEKLAERTGMLQPRISAILKPGKVRPNIETLRRLASAFDCGLLVRFAPYGELVKWSDQFDPDNFRVPSFHDDVVFNALEEPKEESERKEAAIAAANPPSQAFSPESGALKRLGLAADIQGEWQRIMDAQAEMAQRFRWYQDNASPLGLGGTGELKDLSESIPRKQQVPSSGVTIFQSDPGGSRGPKIVPIDIKRKRAA